MARVQVYVSVNGGAETLMAETDGGSSTSVNFIDPGNFYDFNLYEGTSRARRLASVRVTGPPVVVTSQPVTVSGTISASPSAVPAGSKSTTVTWTVS